MARVLFLTLVKIPAAILITAIASISMVIVLAVCLVIMGLLIYLPVAFMLLD